MTAKPQFVCNDNRDLPGHRSVYSDASDTGYGGYTVKHDMHIAQWNWLPDEAVQSAMWRTEL